jgi:hypothetical protein
LLSRKLIGCLLLLCVTLFLSSSAYGCSCVTGKPIEEDPQKLLDSLRKYYRHEFKGAVFAGKVLTIDRVVITASDGLPMELKEFTFEVEKYWVGVASRTIKIRTISGSCAVRFQVGESYLVNATRESLGLSTNICHYWSKEDYQPDGPAAVRYKEILGPPKNFPAK